MKRLTGFAVITLFLLVCGNAFGSHVQLGFLSNDMSIQYCDYEDFKVYNSTLAGGIHNQADCGLYDGSMIGIQDTFSASNLPLTGDVVAFADSVIDAGCFCFSGEQAIWITQTQPYNIHSPHIGWEYLYNTYDAFYAYVGNYGFLTTTLGPVAPVGQGKTAPRSTANPSRDHNAMK